MAGRHSGTDPASLDFSINCPLPDVIGGIHHGCQIGLETLEFDFNRRVHSPKTGPVRTDEFSFHRLYKSLIFNFINQPVVLQILYNSLKLFPL